MIKIMIKKIYRLFNGIRKIIRRKYYTCIVKMQSKSVGDNLTVNFKSHSTDTTVLGNNVNFNGVDIQGSGDVIIGDNFHSGSDIVIITQNHNYDGGSMIPYDDTFILKSVVIKDNVWIGSRVTILGGCVIGEGSIIQAGSVVVSDVPDFAIVGGHPATVFSYRDIEHYNQLKKEKRFH